MSNGFVIIKMCYVHNQWYNISCATLYMKSSLQGVSSCNFFRHIMLLYYHNLTLDKNTPNMVKELFFQ